MPQASAAGITSASAERLSREYSTWLVASSARPGTARCQVAPWADCQPVQLLTPTYDARPLVTAIVERAERLLDRSVVGPDVHLPQVEVVDAEPLQRRVEGG